MKYVDRLVEAMKWLGEQEDTVFIGQSVRWPGTGMYWSIKDIPDEKKIELPVVEDMQMGMCIGMALEGCIPISVYPRMDFLILACNQLVNHLDKMELMSDGQFKPKVIIRTSVGSIKPLFPGPQHIQDHTEALKLMLTNVEVVKLDKDSDPLQEYQDAYLRNISTILIEMPDLYQEEITTWMEKSLYGKMEEIA